MSVHLQFEIEGEKQVSVELGIAADGVKKWDKPLAKVGDTLLKSFDLNFAARGALFGGWPARKPQYKKGQRVDTWPLLEKTGAMRKGFRSDVNEDYVKLDNKLPYFKYHQSKEPRKKIPRRIMMKIDQQRRNEIIKIFQAHIVQVTRGKKM